MKLLLCPVGASCFLTSISILAVSALLEVRNKAEAKRRQQELIEEAEKEGRPTDDIKVPMLTSEAQYTVHSVMFVFDICGLVVSSIVCVYFTRCRLNQARLTGYMEIKRRPIPRRWGKLSVYMYVCDLSFYGSISDVARVDISAILF